MGKPFIQRSILLTGIILVVVGGQGGSATAELTQCDGIWTNRPCLGERGGSIAETQRTARPEAEIDLDRKKLLLHDLGIKTSAARIEFGFEVGILAERTLCLSPETTVAQCEAAVDKKRKEIEERTLRAAKLKATQAGSSARQVEDGPASKDKPTVITIIQESSDHEDHKHRRQEKGGESKPQRRLPGSVSSAPAVPLPQQGAVDRLVSPTR